MKNVLTNKANYLLQVVSINTEVSTNTIVQCECFDLINISYGGKQVRTILSFLTMYKTVYMTWLWSHVHAHLCPKFYFTCLGSVFN